MKKLKLLICSVFSFVVLMTCFCFDSFAGSWREETGTWRYIKDDGSYPTNQWMWIDGNFDGYAECYYFDSEGHCSINTTTQDGFRVDENGAWTVNEAVQRKISVTGTLDYYDKRTAL